MTAQETYVNWQNECRYAKAVGSQKTPTAKEEFPAKQFDSAEKSTQCKSIKPNYFVFVLIFFRTK